MSPNHTSCSNIFAGHSWQHRLSWQPVQVLDFERESEYILVVSAQNPVGLVRGRYGPASTATVSIFVDDINEGPVLSQSHYEVNVREGEEPGRVIATIRGYDPDSHPIR